MSQWFQATLESNVENSIRFHGLGIILRGSWLCPLGLHHYPQFLLPKV